LKTLVVEDDVAARILYDFVLRERGCLPTVFGTATEAWQAYEPRMFDLAILDWLLPGTLDGLDLCRLIRGTEGGSTPVILMVTSRSEPGDLAAVLDAGADDYLIKPVNKRNLDIRLEIAERLARRRRAREAGVHGNPRS